MSIEPKDEPLEEGKKKIKEVKKKASGKKVEPKKLEKKDILEGINYKLTEVKGHLRTTDTQTHLLELNINGKLFKMGLHGEPDDVAIKKWYDNLGNRK
jgi:hypothetical protein